MQTTLPKIMMPVCCGALLVSIACSPGHMESSSDASTEASGGEDDAMCPGDGGTTQIVDEAALECEYLAPVTDCCCFPMGPNIVPGFKSLCARPFLCAELINPECSLTLQGSLCPETIDCHIRALQAREYGVLRWSNPCSGGFQEYNTEFYIVGDGTVFERWYGLEVQVDGGAVRRALRSPDYFAECLALEEIRDRHACMLEGILPEALDVCY